MERTAGFTKSEWGLPNLLVEVWLGFLFVNFDAAAKPLAPTLAAYEPFLEHYDLANAVNPGSFTLTDLPWNWKVMFENFNDGYHANRLHHTIQDFCPSNLAAFPVKWDEASNVIFRTNGYTHIDGGFNATTKALLPVFPDLTEEERWRSTFALVPPTLCLGTAPDQAFYFIVTPKTAETIDVEIGYLLAPERTGASDVRTPLRDERRRRAGVRPAGSGRHRPRCSAACIRASRPEAGTRGKRRATCSSTGGWFSATGSTGRPTAISLTSMRILVTSTPGMGHLNALLPLMFALQDAGHDLLVVTAAESCERVAGYGFKVRPGGLAGNERRATLAPRMPEILALPPRRRRGHYLRGLFAEGAAPVMRVALQPVFYDFRPDIVIHETGELAGAPMAVARGIPHLTVCVQRRPSRVGPRHDAGSDRAGVDRRGFAFAENGRRAGQRLPTPVPAIVRTGSVEPCRAADARGSCRPRHRVTAALARQPRHPAPTCLRDVGNGAVGGHGTLGRRLRRAWSMDVDAVATIGNHVDPSILGEVPGNVRVERFVPQRFVLDRAAAVMSHAGAGSVLGASRRGIPQVLNPLGADQWENADAATEGGLAITCELDQRSDVDIAAALSCILNDPEYRHAAAKVADEIEAMPAPADHVATIEALVG